MANLEFLKTFLVAADTGTFRGVASARSVTVSAISQQIKTLEAQLEVPLFERVGRRVRLTSHGRELARQLRPAFSQIEDALGALEGTFQSVQGLVHVGMPRAFGRHWMRRRLSALLAAHPALGVRLTLGVPSTLERRLVEGQLDLGILVRRPSSATLETLPIAEESFVAVAAPSFVARSGTPRTEEEFSALGWGAFDKELSMLTAWWQSHFGPTATPRRVVAEVADLDALVDLAVEGACLTVLPAYLVHDHLEAGRLVRLVPVHTERRAPSRSSNTIYLAWRRAAVQPARTVVVRDALARP